FALTSYEFESVPRSVEQKKTCGGLSIRRSRSWTSESLIRIQHRSKSSVQTSETGLTSHSKKRSRSFPRGIDEYSGFIRLKSGATRISHAWHTPRFIRS